MVGFALAKGARLNTRLPEDFFQPVGLGTGIRVFREVEQKEGGIPLPALTWVTAEKSTCFSGSFPNFCR